MHFHRASFQRSQLLVQRRCKDLIAKAWLPGAHEEDAMPRRRPKRKRLATEQELDPLVKHVAGDLN